MNSNFKENVYSSYIEDDESRLSEKLSLFFHELVNRKVNNIEGGLQASLVILSDRFGAKVCERDGIGLHSQSHVNLIRYLNGKDDFLSEREMSKYYLWKEEQDILIRNIECRVISGDNSFLFLISGKYAEMTDFQRKVLKNIFQIIDEIYHNGVYESIKVGLYISDKQIGPEEFTDNLLEELNLAINYPVK